MGFEIATMSHEIVSITAAMGYRVLIIIKQMPHLSAYTNYHELRCIKVLQASIYALSYWGVHMIQVICT